MFHMLKSLRLLENHTLNLSYKNTSKKSMGQKFSCFFPFLRVNKLLRNQQLPQKS